MTENSANKELLDALIRLESCLHAPIVPGELPTWFESAASASKDVAHLLRAEVSHAHAETYRAILEQDPAQAARIEDLRRADQDLLVQANEARQQIESLRNAAEKREPREQSLDRERETLVDEAIEFVLAVRKQETAITTWFVEAFQRDRGVAD